MLAGVDELVVELVAGVWQRPNDGRDFHEVGARASDQGDVFFYRGAHRTPPCTQRIKYWP